MWRIIHQFGSPPWVYRFCDRVIPWLLPLTAVALIVGSAWGLLFAPTDYKQGDSYRIIYIHVPAAVVSLAGYYIMAFAGLVSLVWRIKLADLAMRAAAPIGAAFTAVALITGAISNNSRIAEQAAQLLGGRIGGYIEVFGALAQQHLRLYEFWIYRCRVFRKGARSRPRSHAWIDLAGYEKAGARPAFLLSLSED